MRGLLTAAILFAGLGLAAAQTKPAAMPRKAADASGRSECVASVGLCVTVPSGWQRLGDVFGGLGFVVAEPHAGSDSAGWPQLTVAALDVPQHKNASGAEVGPSLDSLVDTVLKPNGATSAETLQRSRLLLNGADAEIVRVRLHDEANNSTTVEAVAMIEGDDGLVYSIALRCAPGDFDRLETIFQRAVHSWRIQPPPPQSQPKQDLDKK